MEVRFAPKILSQLSGRGWTKEMVKAAMESPLKTVAVRDTRYLAEGIRNNEAATAYYSRAGGYVVRNDRTGDIVQVSKRSDEGWIGP